MPIENLHSVRAVPHSGLPRDQLKAQGPSRTCNESKEEEEEEGRDFRPGLGRRSFTLSAGSPKESRVV